MELTFAPSMVTEPVSGCKEPSIKRSKVVFPEPEGPIIAVVEPSLNNALALSKIRRFPYENPTWSSSSME